MDSPPDSLDIAKLKRVPLGLDEIEKSQESSVAKVDSQLSTSYSASTHAADIDEGTGSTSFPEPHRSRSKIVGSVLAVHLVPPTSASHDDAGGSAAAGHTIVHEERLNASLESGIPKMSARDTVAGDTQPISQSIYENIISREKSFQSALHSQLKFSDDNVEGDENSVRTTAGEGESGHVNLLADFDSASVKLGVEPRCSSDDDEVDSLKDGHSSPSQFPSYNNVFPESQRFLTTPVTAKKRDQVPNMAATTPSHPRNPLAADLNSSGGILPLSQLFRATQTPTSPFIPHLPSGPLSDRPSPDLPIQARPRDQYTSSPSRTPGAGTILTRTHTDPFAYISMDESQKRRKESREDRRTKSAEDLSSAEPIDKLFEEGSSLVQRLNRRRVIEQETSACLASISHERPLKSVTADRSDASGRPSNRAVSIEAEADKTQEMSAPLDEEDMSEVETDKEDVPVVSSHSQTRQVPLTSDEDKENQVSPYDDVVTTATHNRLSQVLSMHQYSTLSDTSRLGPLDSGTGVHTTQSQQVINVRDSQPSPSQDGSIKLQKNLDFSQPESLHIQSSYDNSSPPTKRQRRQVLVKESSILQYDVQFERQNDQSVPSVRASTRVSQNQTCSADQNYSARSGTEKPSSMPSLVANTPTHKIAEDIIPETSIPESSPHRNQQSTQAPKFSIGLVPMQEVEEEDDDLPPQPPLRPRNSGSSSLEGATKRKRFFAGFSPEKGRIKTLTELSSDVSPQSSPGDDIDLNDFLRNEEDPHFSKVFKISTHNTPRKRLRTTEDYLSSQAGSSPLKNVESIQPLNVDEHEQTEQHIPDPESPSVTPMRAIARRQRVRTTARGEDMYEMAGSPRSQKKAQVPRESFSSQNLSERASSLEVSDLHSKHPPKGDSSQSSKDCEKQSQEMQTAPEDPFVPSGVQPSTRGLEVDTITPVVQTPAPEDPIIAPNQVLAFWNGRKRAYYPATFMHSSDPRRCVVAFADSGPVDVALGSVKRLQLQIGDAIKIDFPNIPKVTHIIRGFSQQLKPEDLTQRNEHGYLPVTDIYGYSTVFVSPKQRKSLPGGGQIENEQTIEVPIYSIYLDMILWNQMKGRSFTVSDSVAAAPPSKLQTPSRGASTPVSPGSRLSRTHLTIRLGLFSGMVFAISLGKQDAHKTRLIKMITTNGGQILEDGFEELFVFPSSAPGVIQADTFARETDDVVEKAIDFRVTPNFENAGFACLIADKHSRRAKYMQALALNLPCLSRRWIEDCVEQNRILDWDHYLLPAGESSFLYGAIKSRVLTSVPADKALFSQIFNHRAKLLDGQSILLVLGRGKLEERHKAYIFLMYALGAARISRVLDLNVARVLLQNHLQKLGQTPKWDWLYVDDSDEAAADGLMNELRQTFLGNRKKKPFGERSSDDKGLLFPRVMSSDLVCQSLILGKICK